MKETEKFPLSLRVLNKNENSIGFAPEGGNSKYIAHAYAKYVFSVKENN